MKSGEKNDLSTLLIFGKNICDWYNFCANTEQIEGYIKNRNR